MKTHSVFRATTKSEELLVDKDTLEIIWATADFHEIDLMLNLAAFLDSQITLKILIRAAWIEVTSLYHKDFKYPPKTETK